MQNNETASHAASQKDLQNHLLTSSEYQEVKDIEVVLEEEEYKEYKYRSPIKNYKFPSKVCLLIDML
jgi:hypothetical protein